MARKTYKVKKYRKNKRTTRKKKYEGGTACLGDKMIFYDSDESKFFNLLSNYLILLHHDFYSGYKYQNIVHYIYKEWNKCHKSNIYNFEVFKEDSKYSNLHEKSRRYGIKKDFNKTVWHGRDKERDYSNIFYDIKVEPHITTISKLRNGVVIENVIFSVDDKIKYITGIKKYENGIEENYKVLLKDIIPSQHNNTAYYDFMQGIMNNETKSPFYNFIKKLDDPFSNYGTTYNPLYNVGTEEEENEEELKRKEEEERKKREIEEIEEIQKKTRAETVFGFGISSPSEEEEELGGGKRRHKRKTYKHKKKYNKHSKKYKYKR